MVRVEFRVGMGAGGDRKMEIKLGLFDTVENHEPRQTDFNKNGVFRREGELTVAESRWPTPGYEMMYSGQKTR